MAKKSASYELALQHRSSATPAYQWLYASLRAEILGGRLRPGSRLPATRDLARQYGLARGTIVKAFDQLASEGYVEGSVGSGTYVSRMLPERLLNIRAQAPPANRPPPTPTAARLSNFGKRARLFHNYENRPIRAFRANLPALDLFPIDLWTRITARCLHRLSVRDLMGCDPLGYPPLRQAIADYLRNSRGVRCMAEQVVIVSGVQEGLDLTARLLLNPGDPVCVENPGYPGAVLTFQAYGAKISSIGIDEAGIAAHRLTRKKARLIYVTPGHQFPLGTTMSLARRLQVLEWAQQCGAIIFEDDYDGEYRYSGRPIPAMQGLDEKSTVFYAGSFSKVLFPGLRLGYLVVPAKWLEAFEAAVSLSLRHAPVMEQLVVADFIRQGHFARHLRRMREVYAHRLSVLLEEAEAILAGLLQISGVEAGLQTVGWLAEGVSAEAARVAAAKRNVDVTPLTSYSRGRMAAEGLQLGFAALDKKEIRRGVLDLAVALESEMRSVRDSKKKSERAVKQSPIS